MKLNTKIDLPQINLIKKKVGGIKLKQKSHQRQLACWLE
jgi:hypothetical protein